MQQICANCSAGFEITDQDIAFYDEVSPAFNGKKEQVPSPTWCPDCRHERRMIWRNERVLYRRTCPVTGKTFLSPFSPESPYTVYDNDYWYSDKWDAKEYGRDFDFSKPFFEQFDALIREVPQVGRSAVSNQNCEYCNQIGWCKDCYLIFEADYNEKCLYSNNIYDSRMCMDTMHSYNNELCYECTDCHDSYNLHYSQNCFNCFDSKFLLNCIGCRHCVACTNLRNQEYHIFNKSYNKEEYEKKLEEMNLGSREGIATAQAQAAEDSLKFPRKSLQGQKNEDSFGDYLWETQRCEDCFDVRRSQDCKYVFNSQNIKKVHDMLVFGTHEGAEFSYENHEIGGGVRNILFSDQVWGGCSNILYSKLCIFNSHDCFGCMGLRHAEYCIFNKQYTKEEYEELVPKIIEHIRSTGEWGQFLPSALSPFAYNETIAQEYHPLSQEEAYQKGHRWKENIDEQMEVEKVIPGDQLPDDISQVPDDVLNWAVRCKVSNRPFRIVKRELDFYRDHNLPLPQLHPDERHKNRMALRNPRKLHSRQCAKCSKDIQTTYSPKKPEIVYCEGCYLKEVY
jgi:hypothetical protein